MNFSYILTCLKSVCNNTIIIISWALLLSTSAFGTKPPFSPIIDFRINRSILKNYVLLRDTFLFPPASISPYSPFFYSLLSTCQFIM